jgi:hypothetical protein
MGETALPLAAARTLSIVVALSVTYPLIPRCFSPCRFLPAYGACSAFVRINESSCGWNVRYSPEDGAKAGFAPIMCAHVGFAPECDQITDVAAGRLCAKNEFHAGTNMSAAAGQQFQCDRF